MEDNRTNRNVPSVKAVATSADIKTKIVTIDFYDKVTPITPDDVPISRITMNAEDYQDFVLGFLRAGINMQQKTGLNFGINIPENNQKKVNKDGMSGQNRE